MDAMELQCINVKIYVEGEMGLDPERFIDLFHGWVGPQVMDEMLVDVADYTHVPNGPGVLAIGLECDYSMDKADGKWGMRYNRKAPLDGDNASRLSTSFASAAKGCEKMEKEFEGELKFSRREFEIFVNDRALAPNTAETFAACREELESALTKVLGHDEFSLTHDENPRGRFRVFVTLARAFDLNAAPLA